MRRISTLRPHLTLKYHKLAKHRGENQGPYFKNVRTVRANLNTDCKKDVKIDPQSCDWVVGTNLSVWIKKWSISWIDHLILSCQHTLYMFC